MIDFPRSCFSVVAMLLRQRSGGRFVGFLALIHALTGMVLFTALLLFARGFARDTLVGSVLAVPIVVPMLAFSLIITGVWTGRTLGLLTYGGPLRLDGPYEDFTGYSGEVLRRRFTVEHEWTLLERHEPTILAVMGIALGLMPWTRAIGLYLVMMSVASAWQTIRDRRANAWEREPESDFAEPLGEIVASGDSVESAFSSLGEVADLLDEEAAEVVRAHAAAQPVELERPVSAAAGATFKHRGSVSVRGTPRATPAFLVGVFLLVANFAAGDIAGLYERSPERWTAAIESLESAPALFGLVRTEDEEGPGELTSAFLAHVDPRELDKRQDRNARAVIEPVQALVDEAAAAAGSVRRAVKDRLGLDLRRESRTDAMNELLLRKETVREAWAALLNAVPQLESDIADAADRLRTANAVGSDASLDEVRAIGVRAVAWKSEAEALSNHIEHIDAMLRTLHLERALNKSPAEDGG